MNGPQDVGGMMGFGPVPVEADEPVFHADWEGRVLGLTLTAASLGHWNLDESRHARESLAPAQYYGSSYYEIWLASLINLLKHHAVVSPEELDAGQSLGPATNSPSLGGRVLPADRAAAAMARAGTYEREAPGPALFTVGDMVRTKNMHPRGHTRLPRYVRGRVGTIERVAGCHVFPDSHAHGGGEDPRWLYTVRFDGRELWGEHAEPGLEVSVDAWEPYLELI